MNKTDPFVTGFTESSRNELRNELEHFVKDMTKRLGYTDEALIQEIRYWQQKYTNPKKAQKTRSYKFHLHICYECKEVISNYDDAVFHHIQRGIQNVHGPKNMVPMHRSKHCHEKHHKVSKSF